jgi:peptide/nickel transport system substrate-binding protein
MVGYTDILKPSHYLKQFHVNYTPLDELESQIEEAGFKKGEWANLFHDKDILNWESTNTKAIGFPSLQPWIMTKSTKQIIEFERNPYYFKVDSARNQLPYIDEIQSSLVQDKEMETLKIISGEVDAANGILMNMPLYKQNEQNGNYTTRLYDMHVTPVDITLNLTYDDPVWREVVQDTRFRQALNMAINREEIIDSIYFGHASLPTNVPSAYNTEKANQLLDEMGLDKKDSEGFRLGPNGDRFTIPFEVTEQDADMVPISELIVDFWNEIGIKTTTKQISLELWNTRRAANELQATLVWVHSPLWYYGDLATVSWAPLWDIWYNSGGEKGEEPPESVKQFYDLMTQTSVSLPNEAKSAFDKTIDLLHTNIYYMNLVDDAKNPYIWNSNIKNVPEKGFAITNSFSAEQVYFDK